MPIQALFRVSLLLFIVSASSVALTQNKQKVDSLNNLISNASSSSERVRLKYLLSREYAHRDVNRELQILREGIREAENVSDTLNLATGYHHLGINLNNRGFTDSAIAMFNIAKRFYVAADINETDKSAKLSSIDLNLGTCYYFKSDYEAAEKAYRRSLTQSLKVEDHSQIAASISNIGICKYITGNNDSALHYFMEALDYREEHGSREAVAESFNTLAEVYYEIGDLKSSEKYTNEALEIYSKLDHKWGLGQTHMNLCNIDKKKEDFQSLHKHALDLFDLAVVQDSRSLKISALGFLITAALKLGDPEEAKKYALNQINETKSAHSPRVLFESYSALSECYLELNKLDSAAYFHQRGAAFLDSFAIDEIHLKLLKTGASIYSRLGQSERSDFYLNRYFSISDSLIQSSKLEKLAEMQAKYETERKDNEIEQLSNEKKLAEAQTKQRTIILFGSLFGIGMLVVFTLIVFRNFQAKQKANRLLEQKNLENEALLKEIHHRVKNNLQVISSLLNLQSSSLSDAAALDAIKDGQNRVKSIALIHQKLYQTEDLGKIDFQDYAEQLTSFLEATFRQAGKKIDLIVNANSIQLDVDTAVPLGLIINELVTNSFKYAFRNQDIGEITISIQNLGNEMLLTVADNGTGLSADFDPKSGNSLGMKLVNILSRQLKGSMNWANENGARFQIRFQEHLEAKKRSA